MFFYKIIIYYLKFKAEKHNKFNTFFLFLKIKIYFKNINQIIPLKSNT